MRVRWNLSFLYCSEAGGKNYERDRALLVPVSDRSKKLNFAV